MGDKKSIREPIICEGCGKLIFDPRTAKTTTHTSKIKGIKSKCQELRDKKYFKIARKKNRNKYKKPLNRSTEKSVMRICLGPNCQGKKKFRSISKYHRQCSSCWNAGYDRTAVKIGFK